MANPALLVITHLTYDFLSLLPAREPLTSRGRRLQDTAQQRQNVVYAPDTTLQIEVIDAAQKLSVQFSDSNELSLRQGERKVVKIWITNSGSETIHTVWMIAGALDEIYINQKDVDKPGLFLSYIVCIDDRTPLQMFLLILKVRIVTLQKTKSPHMGHILFLCQNR